jgi:pyrimidine-nucleoside phosphorylase
MIQRQGGDEMVVKDSGRLPQARLRLEVNSPADGYITMLDALKVGKACTRLGAGRSALRDRVDPSVGVCLLKKVGDRVSRSELVGLVMANDAGQGQEAVDQIREAMAFSENQPDVGPVVLDLIDPSASREISGAGD